MAETSSNNPDSVTNSPGTVLRRCREYHGISLDEAADATKMGKNYLIALENDKINEFASQAYLKGFLRIYTTYLGLNPDDMIRLYERQYAPPGDAPASVRQSERDGDGESPKRRKMLQKILLPAFLLFLIIITSSIINRSNVPAERQQAPVQPAGQQVVQAIQPVQSSVRTPPPPKKPENATIPAEQPAETKTAEQSAAKPADSKGFVVRMKVTQGGMLNVTIDGAVTQNYELAVGDAIEWKADKQLVLELSNAGGVEVELNNKPLKPLGPAGKPAYIVLDAEGIRS